jgi:hypothetical protein
MSGSADKKKEDDSFDDTTNLNKISDASITEISTYNNPELSKSNDLELGHTGVVPLSQQSTGDSYYSPPRI